MISYHSEWAMCNDGYPGPLKVMYEIWAVIILRGEKNPADIRGALSFAECVLAVQFVISVTGKAGYEESLIQRSKKNPALRSRHIVTNVVVTHSGCLS